MGHLLTTLTLGPLLYLQGWTARRSTPRLPEPPGARSGTRGHGPRLRLLLLGDSSAAGVGTDHQDQALSGRVVGALAPHRTVEWVLHAVTGATTASTLERLAELDGQRFDVAVVSLGVNDITTGVLRPTWRRGQAELRARLRSELGVRWIVASGLPPVHGFPALPQPLRWYLGRRAHQFDRDLRTDVTEEGATFLSVRFTEDPAMMARDGFHPGPQIYAEWGRRVAERILEVTGASPESR